MDLDGISLYEWTHGPSWLAWSKGWQFSALSALVKLMNYRNCCGHDNSTINIIMVLLLLLGHVAVVCV